MGRRRFDTAPDYIPICIYVHQTGSTCHVTALCPNSDDSCARARRRATTAAAGRLRARSAPHPETVPLEGCRTALQSAWRGPGWARFFGAPAVDDAGGGLAPPPVAVSGGGAAHRRRERVFRGRFGALSGCLPGFRRGCLARLLWLGGVFWGLWYGFLHARRRGKRCRGAAVWCPRHRYARGAWAGDLAGAAGRASPAPRLVPGRLGPVFPKRGSCGGSPALRALRQ